MRSRPLLGIALATFVCLAAVGAGGSDHSGSAAMPDSAIGLSRSSVFSVPVPPPVTPNASSPGETSPLPRAYPGAPPRVPHAVADFLPITRAENQCLGCHDRENAESVGAVPVPANHYRDLRNAPQTERERIAGARYVCVTCHVTFTDQKPPVANTFAR